MNVIGCRGGGIGLIEDLWKPREAALWHRISKAKMRPPSRIPCILMKEGREELEKSREDGSGGGLVDVVVRPRPSLGLVRVYYWSGGISPEVTQTLQLAAPILEY